jgi:hypothetical protein
MRNLNTAGAIREIADGWKIASVAQAQPNHLCCELRRFVATSYDCHRIDLGAAPVWRELLGMRIA